MRYSVLTNRCRLGPTILVYSLCYYECNHTYKVCLGESRSRGLQGYWPIRITVKTQRGIDDILHGRIRDDLVSPTPYDAWTT